jgi:hypothetical protein
MGWVWAREEIFWKSTSWKNEKVTEKQYNIILCISGK